MFDHSLTCRLTTSQDKGELVMIIPEKHCHLLALDVVKLLIAKLRGENNDLLCDAGMLICKLELFCAA